jgi:hypothetical protein
LVAQQQVFDAKVPFQFSAGDRTLPAGEYRLTRHNDFLNVENRGDYSSALILASGTDSSSDGQVHLVFDHVNDLYFLRKVVAPAGSIELAVSKTEKKAEMDQRRLSSANPPVASAPVAIIGGQ